MICHCDGPPHPYERTWCGEGLGSNGKKINPVITSGFSDPVPRDDPIPRYAQLDLWMALGYDPNEYEAFREEHGFAETWSTLLLHVRLKAND